MRRPRLRVSLEGQQGASVSGVSIGSNDAVLVLASSVTFLVAVW